MNSPSSRSISTAPAGKRRLRELDSLRGIAASCVLLFHLSWAANDHYHQWPFQVSWGHFGVELFFEISGFVILMTLEKSAGVVDFLISRVTRLYPAYWCAVLLTSGVLWLVSSPVAPSLPTVLADLTMLQTLLRVRSIDPSYWTLTAELIFYVLIVAWYRFRGSRWPDIEYYALGWIAFAALTRSVRALTQTGQLPGIIATPTLLYYGQFFIVGLCVYRLYSGNTRALTTGTLLAACALSLFGGSAGSMSAAPLPYFLLTCGCAAMVYLASQARVPLLRFPVLTLLGDISYPLYLIHQVVGTELMTQAYLHRLPRWLSLPSIILVLVALAYLIHRAVEVPARTVLRAKLRNLARAPDPETQTAPGPTAAP